MHKKMPATTWLAWVHVFNYFTCLLGRGGSYSSSVKHVKNVIHGTFFYAKPVENPSLHMHKYNVTYYIDRFIR